MILVIITLSFFIGVAVSAFFFLIRLNGLEERYIRQLRLRRNMLNALSHQLREPLNKLFPQVQMLSRLGASNEAKREKLSLSVSSSVKSVGGVLESLTDVIESFDGKKTNASEVFSSEALLNTVVSENCPAGFEVVVAPLKADNDSGLLTGNAEEIAKSLAAILRHCAGVSDDDNLVVRQTINRAGKKSVLTFGFELNNIVMSNELRKCYFDFSYSEANPHLKGRPDSLIGLFLAREAALRAGGQISVDQLGGSKVAFTYSVPVGVSSIGPAATETAASVAKPSLAASESHTPEMRKLTNTVVGALTNKIVLIADDVETNRLVLEEMLRTMGLTKVVHASGGKEVIDYCRQMQFDLVFMDIQMPDMDGLKATEGVRSLGGGNASIPIIAVTGASRIVTEELCLKAGMNGYLEKPLSLEAILSVLKREKSKLAAA